MHLIAGWPVLNLLAVAALSTAALVDRRLRTIVNWFLLPALLEGVVVLLYFSKVS
jgi:hypothetical protein